MKTYSIKERQNTIQHDFFDLDPENKMQIFTVYANEKVAETDIRGLERIAGQFDNSLTVITCEDEMESGGYANRRIIACKPVNK